MIGRDKRTGKQYAIKRLDKAHIVKNNKVKYVMIERDALSRMNHPGIVKLYWTYKDNRSLCKRELVKSKETLFIPYYDRFCVGSGQEWRTVYLY